MAMATAMATPFLLSSLKQPQPAIFFITRSPFTSLSTLVPTTTNTHLRETYIRRVPFLSSSSSSRTGRNPPPENECPVPFDQQPINEYQNLSTSFGFSWASGDAVEFGSRLLAVGLFFALFVGLPVSWFGTAGLGNSDPVELFLGPVSSGVFVVTLAVLRMYLGWAYVGNRLLSATVEYEETGWYDGQIWVKTAEVMARDRLLGLYQVKPVLSRLKNTLVGLGASLLVCSILFNYDISEGINKSSDEVRERAIAGAYNEDSARSFEPDTFCGEPGPL